MDTTDNTQRYSCEIVSHRIPKRLWLESFNNREWDRGRTMNPDYEVTRFASAISYFGLQCNAMQADRVQAQPQPRRCELASRHTSHHIQSTAEEHKKQLSLDTISRVICGVCRQINAITRVKSAANKSSSYPQAWVPPSHEDRVLRAGWAYPRVVSFIIIIIISKWETGND